MSSFFSRLRELVTSGINAVSSSNALSTPLIQDDQNTAEENEDADKDGVSDVSLFKFWG